MPRCICFSSLNSEGKSIIVFSQSWEKVNIFRSSTVCVFSLRLESLLCICPFLNRFSFPILTLRSDWTRKWIIRLSYFLHVSSAAADMVIAAFQRGGKCTEKSVATQKATAIFKTSSLASSWALCQQLSHHNHPHTAARTHGPTHMNACANK